MRKHDLIGLAVMVGLLIFLPLVLSLLLGRASRPKKPADIRTPSATNNK
jgi:hypothetical protein